MAETSDPDKKKKVLWLMEEVAENGYDTSKFNTYFFERYKQRLDVGIISFDRLKVVVNEYKA